MMRKVVLLAACLPFAVTLMALPAAADDRQDCASKKSARKLEACTALINTGPETPNLANAYRNRGVAHAQRSEYDQAIADFNKAIALDPNYATAYNDRAVAYTSKTFSAPWPMSPRPSSAPRNLPSSL